MIRKRIRDIRNDELIDAAIAALHRKGFASVTMAEIAAEAGASAASINYYFGAKDRLLEATMRRLMSTLRTALLERFEAARTPAERLMAIVEANFDDRVFTIEQCSVWVQFWAAAPYRDGLARLHRINRSRVQSNMRAEMRALLPDETAEIARVALQNYMDGVWLEAAQSRGALDPAEERRKALRVARLLISAEV
ncbi:MAG: transcriptional regulator BetI [Pseudomonadota bacterium]